MSCDHKTQYHHTERTRRDGKCVWICSLCAKHDTWSESWGYWGSIECTKGGLSNGCQTAQIDYVWCSEECRKNLMLKRGVDPDQERPLDRPKGPHRGGKKRKPKATTEETTETVYCSAAEVNPW